MANRIEIIIDSVTRGLEDGLNKSQTGLGKFGKAATVAGLALAGGLAVGLEKSVKAAEEAQVSTARLDAAFKSAGETSKKYSSQIDGAEAAGRKLGFANTDTRDSIATLEVATKNGALAIKDLSVAEDIARFKHIGLADASKVLTTAMAGSQRGAKMLGIQITAVTAAQDEVKRAYKDHTTAAYANALATAKVADKQSTANQVIAAVTERLHGQAKAYADTAAGGMAQFHAQINSLEENLGAALLPAVVAVTDKLAALAGYLAQHTTLAKALVIAVGALAAVLLSASVAQAVLNLAVLANPYVAAAVAIAALVAGLVYLEAKYKIVTRAVDFLKQHLELLIAIPIIGWTAYVAAQIITHWNQIKGAVSAAINAVITAIHALETAYNAVKDAGTATANAFVSSWNGAKAGVSSAMNAIESAVRAVERAFNATKDAIKSVIDWLGHHFTVPVLGPIITLFDALYQAIMDVINAVKSLISWLSKIHVPSIHIPGVPNIPGLASGGIVTSPTIAMVGERGPEAVIPLNQLGSVTGGGGGAVFNITVHGFVGNDQDIATRILEAGALQMRGGRVPAFTQAVKAT